MSLSARPQAESSAHTPAPSSPTPSLTEDTPWDALQLPAANFCGAFFVPQSTDGDADDVELHAPDTPASAPPVKTASLPSAARQTWIVIVEVKPHAIAAEEPTSPAPQLAPDCPATGEQPWEAMGRAFEAAATAEGTAPDTAADAVHTDVPRVLRPHHFVVAWRRAEDSQHAPSLNPHTDFRTHGQPSPVVHNVPMPHTPGLPEGASFEVFHPQ